jgi:hypothetical protein
MPDTNQAIYDMSEYSGVIPEFASSHVDPERDGQPARLGERAQVLARAAKQQQQKSNGLAALAGGSVRSESSAASCDATWSVDEQVAYYQKMLGALGISPPAEVPVTTMAENGPRL